MTRNHPSTIRSRSRTLLGSWFLGFLTAMLVLAGNPALLRADAEGSTEVLRAATDRWPVHISYFPVKGAQGGSGNQSAPVVVLLHGKNGDRLLWEKQGGGKLSGLVEVLQQEGYAVVTVDLRKHGESVPEGEAAALVNSDYQNMWRGDLEAVKQFLFEEHQAKRLNMNKLAIVAADMSAPIAAAFAEYDWKKLPYDDSPTPSGRTPRGQDVRALVLLSPSRTAGTVNINRSLAFLKDPRIGLSVLLCVGDQDSEDGGLSKTLQQLVGGHPQNKDRVYLQEYPVKYRGTDLLDNTKFQTVAHILGFLDKHLKQLDGEWRDRRSRLER